MAEEATSVVQETVAPKRRGRPPAKVDVSRMVKVRNTGDRQVCTAAGCIKPGEEGSMTVLDARRLRKYVEVVRGR